MYIQQNCRANYYFKPLVVKIVSKHREFEKPKYLDKTKARLILTALQFDSNSIDITYCVTKAADNI